ncbi:MAG: hypothetical protein OXU86_04835 [Thaumarchaeota archaeon]|nr:hypothetical protein [Nitrososphaerota archaeon]MDD9812803.1 hypothetical protein [Nitrososphaerota archaeon]MDD9826077.1 hypothetical protein [Nitrososphaerota archaeon]MDD9843086.1 hypothetical protein [Nitrososphaerota archaeon]
MALDDKVEFRMLDYARLENEYMSFKLEDDTVVKVKVDLDRVGKATNYTNPDGTPHYAINTSVKISVLPAERTFTVPRGHVKGKAEAPPPPRQMFK